MRLLIVVIMCVASAFAGAYYSYKMSGKWKEIDQSARNIRQEMDDKVYLLGEQADLLHEKLRSCLDDKYICCK